MKTIPVDTNPARLGDLQVLRVTAELDDKGVQKKDRNTQEPGWLVECLHRPAQVGDFTPRAAVEVVKVYGPEPVLDEMGTPSFVGLVARPWQMGDRSGVTLVAEAVTTGAPKFGAPKGEK